MDHAVTAAHGRSAVADLPGGARIERLTSTSGAAFSAVRDPNHAAMLVLRRLGTVKGWLSPDGSQAVVWPGRFGTHFQVFGGLAELGWHPFRSAQDDLVMGETEAATAAVRTSPRIAAMFAGPFRAGGLVDTPEGDGWADEIVVGAAAEEGAPAAPG